jgi:thioesterase domain-containing protein
MVAKRLALAFCAISFLQTSFAGFERFWIFSKGADTQVNETWNALSEDEQRALIKRYQSLKEIPEKESSALQQRMDWFTQLPEQDKQKMREVWQQMSISERNEMRQRMQKASPDERISIREEYMHKYLQTNAVHTE